MRNALRWLLPLALSAAAVLPYLSRPVLARHKELRVVLTARHMAESGDWTTPEYLGHLRLRKPPLMYWAVASSFRAAGNTESVWAARLPTALCGIALALAVTWGGAWLVGRRRATMAACVLAATPLFWMHARHAESDVPLALFTTLAALLAYRASTVRRGALAWWLAAGASAGVGFLVKGPAAIGLPLAALAAAATRRRTRSGLRAPSLLAALGVFLLVAAPWYAFAWFSPRLQEGMGEAVGSEMSRTALGENHPGTILFYVEQLAVLLLPWSPLLPLGLWRAAQRWGNRSRSRFLAGWFLTALLLLSGVGNKQVHYAVLLLPPAALLVAGALPARRRPVSRWNLAGFAPRYVRWALGGCAALGIGVAVLPRLVGGLPLLPFALAGAALASGAGWACWRGSRAPVLALGGCGLVAATLYGGWLENRYTDRPALRDFAVRARERLVPDARILAVVGVREAPVLEYYLHRPLRECGSFEEAQAQAGPGDAVVLSRRGWRPEEVAALPPADLVVGDGRWRLISFLFLRR